MRPGLPRGSAPYSERPIILGPRQALAQVLQ
jgi:hypothetical protein